MARFLGLLPTDALPVTLAELKAGYYSFGTPILATTDTILDDAATHGTNTVTYKAADLLAQPDVPRILVLTPSGAVTAGNIVVTGLDIAGEKIIDTVAVDAANAVYTALAFKTIESIAFPPTANNRTWDVGVGAKLGLPFKLAAKPLAFEFTAGVFDAAAGTYTVNATVLAKNVFTPHTTLTGSAEVGLLLFL